MVDHLRPSWPDHAGGAAPLAALTAIPADLASLADYERRAPAHLPPATWRHIAEGSGEGRALAANRAGFGRWRLRPRALADLFGGGGTALTLLGQHHAAPLIVAPLAYARLAHPEGELALVRAATAIGIGLALSTLASTTIEDVARARLAAAAELGVTPAPLWFQLYLQPDRETSLALVRRAEAAGYGAIVLTIDAGIKAAGLTLPPGIVAANLGGADAARQVAAPRGRILFGTPLVDAMPTWADLAWLRGATRLPLIVKGMVLGDDLDRLSDAGIDALVLSNHGGRVLDALPSALDVLPEVAAHVGTRLPLLIDGGVRSGGDIVTALCLGARAVMIGRPVLNALAVAGLAGVAHTLHLLRAETEAVMAQLGCPGVADLTPSRVMPA